MQKMSNYSIKCVPYYTKIVPLYYTKIPLKDFSNSTSGCCQCAKNFNSKADYHFRGYRNWEDSEQYKYVQKLLHGIKAEKQPPSWFARFCYDTTRTPFFKTVGNFDKNFARRMINVELHNIWIILYILLVHILLYDSYIILKLKSL